MQAIAAVALGGALGAVLRYLVYIQAGKWFGPDFPWGTLAVNVLGGLAMGALVESFALIWSPGQAVRLFLTAGLLGGFTTFSAFSLEVVLLLERGESAAAAAYMLASVALSVLALMLGLRLVRLMLA